MRQTHQILSLLALAVLTKALVDDDTSTPANAKKETRAEKRAEKEERLKQEAQKANDVVTDDRKKLQTSITNLDELVAEVQHVGRNSSQVKASAQELAEEVQKEAKQVHKQDKQQAIDLYEKSLSTLKSTDPTTNWHREEKAARENAEKVDKVTEEEEKTGRQMLRQNHHQTARKVDNAWHEADQAARAMLRDRNHLENAERRAGTKEMEYEAEEEKNERFAERSQDYASDMHDKADDAVEDFFEEAEDHLYEIQRKGRRQEHHERHEEIRDAVKNLRQGRREAREAAKAEEKKGSEAKKTSQTNQAQASQELLAIPDASEFCLYSIAGASLGFVAFLIVRLRTRRVQINQEILG